MMNCHKSGYHGVRHTPLTTGDTGEHGVRHAPLTTGDTGEHGVRHAPLTTGEHGGKFSSTFLLLCI